MEMLVNVSHISRLTVIGRTHHDRSHYCFQSSYWGEVKKFTSWQNLWVRAHVSEIRSFDTLVLFKEYIAYIPFGFDKEGSESVIREFVSLLQPFLPKSIKFVRIDLPWGDSNVHFPTNHHSIQPTKTIHIPLLENFESSFKKRAVRHIKKCEQHSLKIREWDSRDLALFDQWYTIYKETAQRDHFSARSKEYLLHLLSQHDEEITPLLYLAFDAKEIVGGIIVLLNSNEAIYLFGSTKRKEDYSPSYALHYWAMKEALQRGCSYYDMYGIEDTRSSFNHINSLSLFKHSFGGVEVKRYPTFDVVYHKMWYRLFMVIERIWFSYKRSRRRS